MPPTDTARALDRGPWHFRRAIGNALGLRPHPVYEWAWLDADGNIHQYENYDTNLNAAMALVDSIQPCFFELKYSLETLDWCAEIADGGWHNLSRGCEDTPALAICRAYLAYTTAAPAADGEEGKG